LNKLFEFMENWKSKLYDMLSFNTFSANQMTGPAIKIKQEPMDETMDQPNRIALLGFNNYPKEHFTQPLSDSSKTVISKCKISVKSFAKDRSKHSMSRSPSPLKYVDEPLQRNIVSTDTQKEAKTRDIDARKEPVSVAHLNELGIKDRNNFLSMEGGDGKTTFYHYKKDEKQMKKKKKESGNQNMNKYEKTELESKTNEEENHSVIETSTNTCDKINDGTEMEDTNSLKANYINDNEPQTTTLLEKVNKIIKSCVLLKEKPSNKDKIIEEVTGEDNSSDFRLEDGELNETEEENKQRGKAKSEKLKDLKKTMIPVTRSPESSQNPESVKSRSTSKSSDTNSLSTSKSNRKSTSNLGRISRSPQQYSKRRRSPSRSRSTSRYQSRSPSRKFFRSRSVSRQGSYNRSPYRGRSMERNHFRRSRERFRSSSRQNSFRYSHRRRSRSFSNSRRSISLEYKRSRATSRSRYGDQKESRSYSPTQNRKNDHWLPIYCCPLQENINVEKSSTMIVTVAPRSQFLFRDNKNCMTRITKWTGKDQINCIYIKPQIVSIDEHLELQIEIENLDPDENVYLKKHESLACLSILSSPIPSSIYSSVHSSGTDHQEIGNKRWFMVASIVLHQKGMQFILFGHQSG